MRLAVAIGVPSPAGPPQNIQVPDDTELGGRDSIAGRLSDEASWLRQCAGWLAYLNADSYRQRLTCARRPDQASSTVAERIPDIDSGLASGQVLGTPTLFINGVIHPCGYDPPTLLAALAAKAENRWLVARLR